jgi:DNA-binding transcriptional LysR family regulator
MNATMGQQTDVGQLAWDDLRLLLSCYRLSSLTAAAAQLDCHPATASRRMTQLEDRLQVGLFRRGKAGLVATPACEAMMPAVQAAEAAIHQALRTAQGTDSEVRGVVRLSMPPGIVDALVVPLLGKLQACHPQIRIEIDASTRYVDLERGEADLVVRVRRPEAGELVCQRLLESPLAVMGAAGRFGGGGPWRLRDLPWLTWDHDLAHLPHTRWLSQLVEPEQIVLRCNAQSALMTAAADGLGVVLCALAEGSQRGLVPVPLASEDQLAVEALPAGILWLVCHGAMRRVPRVAAVWSFLLAEVGQMRAQGMAV